MQHEIPYGALLHILQSLPDANSRRSDIIRFDAYAYDHTCMYRGGDSPVQNAACVELTFIRKMTPHGYVWHLLI